MRGLAVGGGDGDARERGGEEDLLSRALEVM